MLKTAKRVLCVTLFVNTYIYALKQCVSTQKMDFISAFYYHCIKRNGYG